MIDLATAEVTTVAGAAWEDNTTRDGAGAAARIYQPIGVDFGPDGMWALTVSQLGCNRAQGAGADDRQPPARQRRPRR